MKLDSQNYYDDFPQHIVDFVRFLADNDLIPDAASLRGSTDQELFEWHDCKLFTEDMTAEGAAFSEVVYAAYVKKVPFKEGATQRWLGRRLRDFRAGRAATPRHHATLLLKKRLAPVIAQCGLAPAPGAAHAFIRQIHGVRVGFWLAMGTHDKALGGAFRFRMAGPLFVTVPRFGNSVTPFDRSQSMAVPEYRLGCWIGQDGRDEMAALNARVQAKLPPRKQWQDPYDDTLVFTYPPYTPRGEAWLRWVDDEDVLAWADFLAVRLPTLLEDVAMAEVERRQGPVA